MFRFEENVPVNDEDGADEVEEEEDEPVVDDPAVVEVLEEPDVV